MNESTVARRRATPVIAASVLAMGLTGLFAAFTAMEQTEGWAAIHHILIWWSAAAQVLVIGSTAYLARHVEKKWSKPLAWGAVVALGTSFFSSEIYRLLGVLELDILFVLFPLLNSVGLALVAAVLVYEDQLSGSSNVRAVFGAKISPAFIIVSALIGHFVATMPASNAFVSGALVVFGGCALTVYLDQEREEEIPDGVSTESGALLLLASIGARIGLLIAAALPIAFYGMTDVMALAAVCSSVGIVTVPAAFGATRFRQEIVREAHPHFRRASVLWWGAIALLLLQLVWIWVTGPTLTSFIPAVAAMIADVAAWESVRRGLAEWGEYEGLPDVGQRANVARFPILVGGAGIFAGYIAAFVSDSVATATLGIASLIAFVAAYLVLQALLAFWHYLRDATYA